MLYYTYKIVFLKGEHKGCYYIGKRSTKKYSSFEKDPYTGSGLFCLRYFKKWGKVSGETYTKELLLTASSDEENSSNEARLIGDLWKTDDKCMNLAAGGAGWKYDHYGENNPNWGKHPSEETRKKIGEASKGRQAMLGHHHSEEAKKKMSEHNASKRPEVRAKISETCKGLHNSPSTEFKAKPVACYKDGELVKIYNKLTDVMMDGFSATAVCNCCKGRRSSYKGFSFTYNN